MASVYIGVIVLLCSNFILAETIPDGTESESLSSKEESSETIYTSCLELLNSGFKDSGIYDIYIYPSMSTKITVYCDMITNGGGWTVFQRRGDYDKAHVNFTRNWSDYKEGFGIVTEEFWIGNEILHWLSSEKKSDLRIDLEDFEGNKKFAQYNDFQVTGASDNYRLKSVGTFVGDGGDGMSYSVGSTFVTFDHNDVNKCSQNYKGGWWYNNCYWSNLNGRYLYGNYHGSEADGITWSPWLGNQYSLKFVEMKLR